MAKPDDRSDNAEKLQNMARHTAGNLEEAEQYLDEHADEISTTEKQNIEAKNERRRASIAGFQEEAQDEANNAE
ncbi:small acid-soluble spore protein Tlp [Paenibacillus mesophilus]|uniref:small acid-soluble spore protein Tlp n=1 Tax=Paenibacillus mesophilus TaxID=2582849 RepID=UPI00110D8C68|nr:small acid-soluble spore protein Tlp [Paenibacillus mesophilus]TMV50287.1 small acid-soluble spore protein Tlp [Paenibacillus mesophilus]